MAEQQPDLSAVVVSQPASEPATAAPETSPVAEGQPPADSQPPQPDAAAETKKALRGVQKRIDELTRARYEAEERGRQEAAAQRQRAELAEQQLNALRQGQTPPQLNQYASLEEYTQAAAEFAAKKIRDQTLSEQQQLYNQQEQTRAQQQQQAAMRANFERVIEGKIQDAVKKYPDFVEVVSSPELPSIINQPAFGAVLDSEAGADIMYYLGKNPAKAHQILSLSPVGQIREIGRIEAAIATGKLVSNAPPPPSSVNTTTGGAAHKNVWDPKLPWKDFVAMRRKNLARK